MVWVWAQQKPGNNAPQTMLECLKTLKDFLPKDFFLAHEPKPWPPCLLLIWIPEAPDGCSHKNHKGFKNPWVFSV